MYKETVIKLGLDNPDTWHQDIRDKLIELYAQITDGTDYYFEKNTGEAIKKILELHRAGETVRIMGFERNIKNLELCGIFIDRTYYNKVCHEMDFPLKNCKKNNEKIGNQVYPKNISLEEMWNAICIITGKKEKMIEVE